MLARMTDRESCAAMAVLIALGWASADAEPTMESWAKMRGEVVKAEELLGADVTNGFNPLGSVTDLVLTADGRQVQYVLYEAPYPYSVFGAEDGFASYDNMEVEGGGASFDVVLRLEEEAAAQAPEALRVTRDQAEQRLVSRLIGEPMRFSGNAEREIEDILIDRDTGAVTHFVVETEENSVFRAQRRTVPADSVMIDETGTVVASMQLAELDNIQDYEPALL
ncbi:MAG: hypothetical protein JXB36_20970 [Gammaproteobacteria bacterium]|nr:hypothetical protein [Gammaproteobacteria bacterium]